MPDQRPVMLTCGACPVAEHAGKHREVWCPVLRERMPESSLCVICRAGLREWVVERQDEADEYERLTEEDRINGLTGAGTVRLSDLQTKFGGEEPPRYGRFLMTLWSEIEGNPDRVCEDCGRYRLDVRRYDCPVCGGVFRLA